MDLSFHIMEREYGVARLLNPEGEPFLNSCVLYFPRRSSTLDIIAAKVP